MKGSIALFAGALPVLVSYSHAIPPVREITSRRSTASAAAPPASAGNKFTSSAAAAVAVAWATASVPLRASSSSNGRGSSSSRSRSRSSASRRVRPRVLLAPARCRPKQRRCTGGAGAVRFGNGLAGVEGWASEARAGVDRDPVGAASSVDGGGAIGAEAAVTSEDDGSRNGEEALGAFVSAVAATAAAAAVVDEGELTCRQLEGVVSREAEVAERQILLRVANLDDYFAIADVRFDVFSPVHATLKHRFRERSCMLMRERRRKGAFCLVAALEGPARAASASTAAADDRGAISGKRGETANGKGGDVVVDKAAEELSDDHVLGTLECSRHEFDGTPLAVDVEDGGSKISRLYLTEVAVRSDCRRMGVGRVLLGLVDDVAKELRTSEVFLHVNEVNDAALRLYEKCGYDEAPDCASNRAFTNSLGLAGGFIGQRHLLLHKTFHQNDNSINDGSGGTGDGASATAPPPPSEL